MRVEVRNGETRRRSERSSKRSENREGTERLDFCSSSCARVHMQAVLALRSCSMASPPRRFSSGSALWACSRAAAVRRSPRSAAPENGRAAIVVLLRLLGSTAYGRPRTEFIRKKPMPPTLAPLTVLTPRESVVCSAANAACNALSSSASISHPSWASESRWSAASGAGPIRAKTA